MRSGNNLKAPKFHQILHVIDYITRHGCPMNYDGSRGDCFGEPKLKIMPSSQTKLKIC